jgi:TetR/AcrR family transcriptional regulator, cholesterol catabolism regulator
MARDRATDTSKLLAAAAETFREKGYHNTTIDDIAEAAGISRPTVYKYTKSKQWLLDRMVAELEQDLGDRLEKLMRAEHDPLTRLRLAIKANIAAATENRTFYAIAFSEQTELSNHARERFTTWAHDVTLTFKDLLDECLFAGSLPDGTDTWLAANLILSMFTSLHRWYDADGPVSPEQLSDQVIHMLGYRSV